MSLSVRVRDVDLPKTYLFESVRATIPLRPTNSFLLAFIMFVMMPRKEFIEMG
jgi:hypothetical protein